MKSEVGNTMKRNIEVNNPLKLWNKGEGYSLQQKQCPSCGNIFKFGRTDKVYCSSKCKSRMYNLQQKSKLCFITLINKQLKVNRNILKAVNKHFKDTQKVELLTMGFNFKYYTGIQLINYEQYKLCYDYGYRFAKNKPYISIIHVTLDENKIIL